MVHLSPIDIDHVLIPEVADCGGPAEGREDMFRNGNAFHAPVVPRFRQVVVEDFGEGDGSIQIVFQDRPGNGEIEPEILGDSGVCEKSDDDAENRP